MPKIGVETKYIAPPDYSFPALALQVTRLAGSYMIWVGTTDESAEDIENAPLYGSLCRDWACAMPPLQVCLSFYDEPRSHKYVAQKVGMPATAASLFRSSSSDIAQSMAQRLGKLFYVFII